MFNFIVMDNRLICYSLVFSFFMHLAFLFAFSSAKMKTIIEPMEQIKVSYQQTKAAVTPSEKKIKDVKVLKEPESSRKIEILAKKGEGAFSANQIKDISKTSLSQMMAQSIVPAVKSWGMERKITIPVLQAEKIVNPKYLTYNDRIRQKIKQRAYMYADNPDFDRGEVYLTFILTSDGILKDIKIIENRTQANYYLKNICLRSIKESAPFPAFPRELSYPELTFNVVISFEIEKN